DPGTKLSKTCKWKQQKGKKEKLGKKRYAWETGFHFQNKILMHIPKAISCRNRPAHQGKAALKWKGTETFGRFCSHTPDCVLHMDLCRCCRWQCPSSFSRTLHDCQGCKTTHDYQWLPATLGYQ